MNFRPLAGLALFLVAAPYAWAVDLDRPDVAAFITEMAREHNYDREVLRDILGEAEIKQSIIELISKPAERTLSWADYRPIFIAQVPGSGSKIARRWRLSARKPAFQSRSSSALWVSKPTSGASRAGTGSSTLSQHWRSTTRPVPRSSAGSG